MREWQMVEINANSTSSQWLASHQLTHCMACEFDHLFKEAAQNYDVISHSHITFSRPSLTSSVKSAFCSKKHCCWPSFKLFIPSLLYFWSHQTWTISCPTSLKNLLLMRRKRLPNWSSLWWVETEWFFYDFYDFSLNIMLALMITH